VKAMKRLAIIVVSLFFVGSFTPLVFAQKTHAPKVKKEIVHGVIVSTDAAKNEVVVKEKKSGAERIISVDPRELQLLKTGEEIKATLKPGTNIAESIKKISKTAASSQKHKK